MRCLKQIFLSRSLALRYEGASPGKAGGGGEGAREDDAASEYRVLPTAFMLRSLS